MNPVPDLKGEVAVVTGSTRGAGKGIALVLGQARATVYVTGRSTGGCSTEGLPGSIGETAEMVSARGGQGIAVRCDHTSEQDVKDLFCRVSQEQGRLDLLVNNAWGGYEHYDYQLFTAPFWELPMSYWEGMFQSGVRSHLLASRLAVPLMLPRNQGLIINTTAWDRDLYLGNLFYDVAKAAVSRMAFGMARELRPHGISCLALAPGFMRTERVMAVHAISPFPLDHTESPEYIGRAVAFLAADPQVMLKSGRVLTVGDLAQEYGFTDIDGRQIPPFKIE
ncbi:MAG: SDR family NAD(P)-dependent oxidoreductase [Methanotrichaceae archaeon]|nr:SDR family NAD(P)-dependent oxidoreductase [Methanotrichaceae archaeon]